MLSVQGKPSKSQDLPDCYWAARLGILLLLLALPLQTRCAKWGGEARRSAMRHTDERVKFLTEVVHGIRVAKLYGWDRPVPKTG